MVKLSPIDNGDQSASRTLILRRAALVPVVLLAMSLLFTSASASAATTDRDAPVILVGVTDLYWEDVTATDMPHLWQLASRSAIGQISVRSVFSTTCAIDGWLTISAGQRSAAPREPTRASDEFVCPMTSDYVTEGSPTNWQELNDWNADTVYSATIGGLAETLLRDTQSLGAAGPGAALALADESGAVAEYIGESEGLTSDSFDGADVAVIDLEPGATPTATDARLRQVLDVVPTEATVLVVGVGSAIDRKHLQVALMTAPGIEHGLLTSNSTRQDGLVLLTDLTETVLARRGLSPTSDMVGSPIEVRPTDASVTDSVSDFADRNVKADAYSSLVGPFFNILLVLQIVLYLVAAVAFRRRAAANEDSNAQPLKAVRVVSIVALFYSLIPLAGFGMNLLPWWQLSRPATAAVASVIVVVALTGTLIRKVWAGDATRQVGVVAAATACLIAGDLAFGGALQQLSLLGYSPIVAGRFYGLGNIAFAVFATSSIFAAMWASEEMRRRGRRPLPVAIAIGVLAITVTGAPVLGADLGGVLALMCGFGVVILALAGRRLTAKIVLAVLGLAVAVVAAISFVDWLRPADARTHLGSFFDSVLTGEAVDIISRKLEANLNVLTGNWLTLLLPAAVGFVVFVLLRRSDDGAAPLVRSFERLPALRPACIGWLVTMTVGLVVNDSGVVVPAVGLMLVVPFLIVISAETVAHKPSISNESATRHNRG